MGSFPVLFFKIKFCAERFQRFDNNLIIKIWICVQKEDLIIGKSPDWRDRQTSDSNLLRRFSFESDL